MEEIKYLYTEELFVYAIKNIKKLIDNNKIKEVNLIIDDLIGKSAHTDLNNILFTGYLYIFKKLINKYSGIERYKKIENLNYILMDHLNNYLYYGHTDTPSLVNRIENIIFSIIEEIDDRKG